MPFEPVDPRVRFPELELRILDGWREADVFARQLELRGLVNTPPPHLSDPNGHAC